MKASTASVSPNLVSIEVDSCQLSLVVQHLLKVRYVPELVCGVAMETLPHVVVHASLCHRPQRYQRGLQGSVTHC